MAKLAARTHETRAALRAILSKIHGLFVCARTDAELPGALGNMVIVARKK